MAKIIHAVAGVLRLGSCVLMTSRPLGKTHALHWEFPGGKIDPGENAVQALIRELKEEIDVEVLAHNCVPVTCIAQSYADSDVQLDVFGITSWLSTPRALEKQDIYWQDIYQPCRKGPLLSTTQKILDLLLAEAYDK